MSQVPFNTRPSVVSKVADLEQLVGMLVQVVSDADLLRAYQQTDGAPGTEAADWLLAEIERRGIGI